MSNQSFVGITIKGVTITQCIESAGVECYVLKCSHCEYVWTMPCDEYWESMDAMCPNGCIHKHKVSCIVRFFDVDTDMQLSWRTLRLFGEFSDVYTAAYTSVKNAESENLYGHIAIIENDGRKVPSISNKGGRFLFVP